MSSGRVTVTFAVGWLEEEFRLLGVPFRERGRISDVIAALDYVIANKDALNIRVVNLSVATGVHESYNSDPLTLAVVGATLALVALMASLVPAYRALRLDPVKILRAE